MNIVYLDNNATTKPAPEVVEAMLPFLGELYANPSSVHRFGQRARHAIDEARAHIAELVGCLDGELLFTSGGTESINTAVRGILNARAPRKKIVTSTVEHSATRELCQQLRREGIDVIEIEVDSKGQLDFNQFQDAVDPETALVTLLWANNETGVLWPPRPFVEVCKAKMVPFHCDATQAVGKVEVNFRAAGIDAASFAAHKFHGPKGGGGLYVRKGLRFSPLLIGGPQERGRRGGTENVAGIVGMGKAAELAKDNLPDTDAILKRKLRLELEILSRIEDTHVNGTIGGRLPNTTNIGFAGLEAEAILLLLSEQSICASAGAACSSGSLEPSHVLRAMKIDPRIAHGSVRFSLSRYTTDQEIDRTFEILPGVIARLRAVLPVGV